MFSSLVSLNGKRLGLAFFKKYAGHLFETNITPEHVTADFTQKTFSLDNVFLSVDYFSNLLHPFGFHVTRIFIKKLTVQVSWDDILQKPSMLCIDTIEIVLKYGQSPRPAKKSNVKKESGPQGLFGLDPEQAAIHTDKEKDTNDSTNFSLPEMGQDLLATLLQRILELAEIKISNVSCRVEFGDDQFQSWTFFVSAMETIGEQVEPDAKNPAFLFPIRTCMVHDIGLLHNSTKFFKLDKIQCILDIYKKTLEIVMGKLEFFTNTQLVCGLISDLEKTNSFSNGFNPKESDDSDSNSLSLYKTNFQLAKCQVNHAFPDDSKIVVFIHGIKAKSCGGSHHLSIFSIKGDTIEPLQESLDVFYDCQTDVKNTYSLYSKTILEIHTIACTVKSTSSVRVSNSPIDFPKIIHPPSQKTITTTISKGFLYIDANQLDLVFKECISIHDFYQSIKKRPPMYSYSSPQSTTFTLLLSNTDILIAVPDVKRQLLYPRKEHLHIEMEPIRLDYVESDKKLYTIKVDHIKAKKAGHSMDVFQHVDSESKSYWLDMDSEIKIETSTKAYVSIRESVDSMDSFFEHHSKKKETVSNQHTKRSESFYLFSDSSKNYLKSHGVLLDDSIKKPDVQWNINTCNLCMESKQEYELVYELLNALLIQYDEKVRAHEKIVEDSDSFSDTDSEYCDSINESNDDEPRNRIQSMEEWIPSESIINSIQIGLECKALHFEIRERGINKSPLFLDLLAIRASILKNSLQEKEMENNFGLVCQVSVQEFQITNIEKDILFHICNSESNKSTDPIHLHLGIKMNHGKKTIHSIFGLEHVLGVLQDPTDEKYKNLVPSINTFWMLELLDFLVPSTILDEYYTVQKIDIPISYFDFFADVRHCVLVAQTRANVASVRMGSMFMNSTMVEKSPHTLLYMIVNDANCFLVPDFQYNNQTFSYFYYNDGYHRLLSLDSCNIQVTQYSPSLQKYILSVKTHTLSPLLYIDVSEVSCVECITCPVSFSVMMDFYDWFCNDGTITVEETIIETEKHKDSNITSDLEKAKANTIWDNPSHVKSTQNPNTSISIDADHFPSSMESISLKKTIFPETKCNITKPHIQAYDDLDASQYSSVSSQDEMKDWEYNVIEQESFLESLNVCDDHYLESLSKDTFSKHVDESVPQRPLIMLKIKPFDCVWRLKTQTKGSQYVESESREKDETEEKKEKKEKKEKQEKKEKKEKKEKTEKELKTTTPIQPESIFLVDPLYVYSEKKGSKPQKLFPEPHFVSSNTFSNDQYSMIAIYIKGFHCVSKVYEQKVNNEKALFSKMRVGLSHLHCKDMVQDSNVHIMVHPLYQPTYSPHKKKIQSDFFHMELVTKYPSMYADGNITVAPVKIHLHHSTLEFLYSWVKNVESIMTKYILKPAPPTWFASVKLSTLEILVDFLPRPFHVNEFSRALVKGDPLGILSLLSMDGVTISLPHVNYTNVRGWDGIGSCIGKTIADEQLGKLIGGVCSGIEPFRPFVNIGGKMIRMFALPYSEYKKKKSVWKSISKTARDFLFTSIMETISAGSTFSVCASTLLNQLHKGLEYGMPAPSVSPKQNAFYYANQPVGFSQGCVDASTSFATRLKQAGRIVFMVEDVSSALVCVPLMVVKTASGVSEASTKLFLGARNELDPQHYKTSLTKYRK